MRFLALAACFCHSMLSSQSPALVTVDSTVAWYQTYQAPSGESVISLAIDSSGNVFSTSACFPVGGTIWFIRKTDPYGHLLWTQTFCAMSAPTDAVTDSKGDLYLAGWSNGSNGQPQSIITKFSSTGQFEWFTSLPTTQPLALHVDTSDNLILAGIYQSTGPYAFLVKYSSSGQQISANILSSINPSAALFMSNGDLLMSGTTPGTGNPAWAVFNSLGNLLFNGSNVNSSTDVYGYLLTSDPLNNVYVCMNHIETSTGNSTFNLSAMDTSGNPLYSTAFDSGNAHLVTASDPDHAYVNTTVDDYGYKSAGVRFLSVPSVNHGLIAADGATGLVRVSNTSTAYNYSEIDTNGQTLWSQSIPAQAFIPMKLMVANGAIYGLNQPTPGGISATLVAKLTKGVALNSLTVSPSVQGSKPLAINVQLNDVAPAGGFSINFTGNANLIGLPHQIVISAGKSSAGFNAQTLPVDASTPVTVSAEAQGAIRTANVTVTPAILSSLTFPSPATVTGGQTITGTVHLNGSTGLAGRAVALSSNNSHATVPSQIVIAPGNSTATFVVQTSAVTANTQVKVTATVSGGSSQSATFTITP